MAFASNARPDRWGNYETNMTAEQMWCNDLYGIREIEC